MPKSITDSAVYSLKDIKAKSLICKDIKKKSTFKRLWKFLSCVHVTYIFISKVCTCVVDPDIKWDASREAKVVVSSLMS